MLFNSYIFVLLFFPLCVIGYFLLNRLQRYTEAKVFLLGMSLWFYGYNNIFYLMILVGSILLNYGVYLWIIQSRKCGKILKLPMVVGVTANLLILLYFKYMDFFIYNINTVFSKDIPFLKIALPLGISFFTFQQISFVVDAYRGEIQDYSLLDYACFVAFFPQLIAGPIVTHEELVPQFKDKTNKRPNVDNIVSGIYIFVLGLAKKVLLADTLGKIVDYGFLQAGQLNTVTSVMTILSYTFQIYFDFSGYCDMAIGIAKSMNIDLPQNFNSPYKATTIVEFWERWHMTLTRFFTRYVYVPLGGNRKGKTRTYINVFVVFLISGFWHGASWNFVLWGLLHGVFNIMTRMARGIVSKIPRFFNWIVTFVFINLTWVFFRAETLTQAVQVLKGLFVKPTSMDWGFYRAIETVEIRELSSILSNNEMFMALMLIFLLVLAFLLATVGRNAYEKYLCFRPTIGNLICTVFLAVWSVLSFAGISTFLYFNF